MNKIRIAVKLSAEGITALRLSGPAELRGTAEIDGVRYRDVGGSYNCGFYGTVMSEGKIVGFEVGLFPDFQEAWSVLAKFKDVRFSENGRRLRLVWAPIGGRIVAGEEEWFQECGLLHAEPDRYCIVLDFPATVSDRLVVPE